MNELALARLGEFVLSHNNTIDTVPRRIPGETDLGGVSFRYADLHALYYQYLQIFQEKLYNFTPARDTDAPLILDCGAHIGLASLFFAKAYPGATIHGYEADPAIATLARHNTTALGATNVSIIPKAVWTSSTPLYFEATGDDGGHGLVNGATGPTRVEAVRLRNVLDQHDRVDLLKMDVEGAEFNLIIDCSKVLKKIDRMVVETHLFRPEEGSLGPMLTTLEMAGFKYVLSDLHHATWRTPREIPPFSSCPTDKYIITVFAWRD